MDFYSPHKSLYLVLKGLGAPKPIGSAPVSVLVRLRCDYGLLQPTQEPMSEEKRLSNAELFR